MTLFIYLFTKPDKYPQRKENILNAKLRNAFGEQTLSWILFESTNFKKLQEFWINQIISIVH